VAKTIAGIRIPDSKLAQEAEEFIKEHQPDMLFNHSVGTYLFGSLAG